MHHDFTHFAPGAFRTTLTAGLVLAVSLAMAQDEDGDARRAVGAGGDVARPAAQEVLGNPILRNALSRSTEGLTFQRAPNGAVSVDLQGRFQNVSVARIGADGKIEVGCVETHDSLAEFLAAHPEAAQDGDSAANREHRDEP